MTHITLHTLDQLSNYETKSIRDFVKSPKTHVFTRLTANMHYHRMLIFVKFIFVTYMYIPIKLTIVLFSEA